MTIVTVEAKHKTHIRVYELGDGNNAIKETDVVVEAGNSYTVEIENKKGVAIIGAQPA